MPFRARIDGQEVVSLEVPRPKWLELRRNKTRVSLSCCGKPGHLRTSNKGIQHFVHEVREGCDWARESPDHVAVKSIIFKACKDAGWHASPEYVGPKWRADVLADNGQHRVAFEVQLSPQSWQQTLERQERYRADSVRACWFFSKCPPDSPGSIVNLSRRELPAFLLIKDGDEFFAVLEQRLIDLHEFTTALLRSQVRFRPATSSRLWQVAFVETKCYKCHEIVHFYYVVEPSSCCGIAYADRYWLANLAGESAVVDRVKQSLVTAKDQTLRIGFPGILSTLAGFEGSRVFECVGCKARLSPRFIEDQIRAAQRSLLESRNGMELVESARIVHRTTVAADGMEPFPMPHWCYARDGQFC